MSREVKGEGRLLRVELSVEQSQEAPSFVVSIRQSVINGSTFTVMNRQNWNVMFLLCTPRRVAPPCAVARGVRWAVSGGGGWRGCGRRRHRRHSPPWPSPAPSPATPARAPAPPPPLHVSSSCLLFFCCFFFNFLKIKSLFLVSSTTKVISNYIVYTIMILSIIILTKLLYHVFN